MDMSVEKKLQFWKEREAKEKDNLLKLQQKQDREAAVLLLMSMRAELASKFSKSSY